MRVCIVTSGNVSTSPRVVKEADALCAAGHEVRVVAVDALADNGERDLAVMAGRAWALERINLRRGDGIGFFHRATGAAWRVVARQAGLADRWVSRYMGLFIRAVVARPADLVIGHTLAGLPVAVLAAERLGARAGFDIEDFHSGELPAGPRYDAERAIVTDVERRYLPRCARVTASSRGIADAIASRYGIARPHVVLNTFPRAERAPSTSASASSASASSGSGRPLSLYWYSQVIGPGRGIEDAVAAVGLLDSRVQLYLRGTLDPAFASEVVGRPNVVILPPVPPPELVARAAEQDIGLALEQPVTENRALCVTNKIFTYMLAGLAVAATDTPGQREILMEAEGAGFLYQPGRPAELAEKIRELLADPAQLARYKAAAWEAADRRFNWDREAQGLVAYLEGR
jgi:glycosyltransferase involved in cell wall biosynthesis